LARGKAFGIARLRLQAAAPSGRGGERVGRYPLAPDNGVPKAHGTQTQVGVLAEGALEAFIEAAGCEQSGSPVGHIGCDPQRSGEVSGAPLGVE
jgi:hypothetical protein